jgi:hypothetical protein
VTAVPPNGEHGAQSWGLVLRVRRCTEVHGATELPITDPRVGPDRERSSLAREETPAD